jgi:biotin transport system permease protein
MAELNIFHYLPKKSLLHAMDGRIKLICMILFSITTSIATRIFDLSILTLVLFIALISSQLPLKKLFTEVRYFLFLIGLVIVVHSFSIPGAPIANIPIHGLTWEGLCSGLLFGWRLILIILISTILTETTPLSLLRNVIEWFLRPIPFIREARVAMMFSLTFVLIPLIFDQASEMMDAQKARCIEGRRSPIKRVLFLIYPLLLHTFMRADEMVFAMESRCYSEDRTPVIFKTKVPDWFFLIFSGLVCSIVFFKFF